MVYLIIALLIFGSDRTEITLPLMDNTSIDSEWELEKNKNGIKVYTRQIEGAKIKEFKAVTTVTSNMEALGSIIDEVSEYTEWQANISSARILEQVNQNEQYLYFTTDVPWPIKDRDVVVYSKKTINNGTLTYTLKGIPDHFKEDEDFLRIRDAKGKWQFVPKGNGKFEVLYQFYGDPAGSIPNWIINMFIVDGPYETLMGLKSRVES